MILTHSFQKIKIVLYNYFFIILYLSLFPSFVYTSSSTSKFFGNPCIKPTMIPVILQDTHTTREESKRRWENIHQEIVMREREREKIEFIHNRRKEGRKKKGRTGGKYRRRIVDHILLYYRRVSLSSHLSFHCSSGLFLVCFPPKERKNQEPGRNKKTHIKEQRNSPTTK